MCYCQENECSTISIIVYSNDYITIVRDNFKKIRSENKIKDEFPSISVQIHAINLAFRCSYNSGHQLFLINFNKWLSSIKFCNIHISTNSVKPVIEFLDFFIFVYFESLTIWCEDDVYVKYKKYYNEELNYIMSFIELFSEKYPDIKVKLDILVFGIIYDD